ncbi:MAG TPA: hypothetical protein VET24_07295 [Actinomycetota bacterium]|nr:hypothetical protein [Actinomycetota bacterium]
MLTTPGEVSRPLESSQWLESRRQQPRSCGAAKYKKQLAAFHVVLVQCSTLRFGGGRHDGGGGQEPQLQPATTLLPSGSGYLLKGKSNGECQPAKPVWMRNAASFIAEDGLTSRPAVGAFLPGGGVHASGDAVQREALSLASRGDELREGKLFH